MTELTVVTPPDEEPVSLDAAKIFLRIGHESEDALITELIQASRARIEQAAGLSLVRRRLKSVWPRWPDAIVRGGAKLPTAPLVSIVSVSVISEDKSVRSVTDSFILDCDRIKLRPGSALPRLVGSEQIELIVDAGFGTAQDVPEDLREAVLRLVADLYARRPSSLSGAGSNDGLPDQVQAILQARRGVRL